MSSSPAPPGSPLRIVYLIDKMGAGGAQTHLRSLASRLDRERFSTEVVCLTRGGVSADRLRLEGVPVTVLGVSRLYSPSAVPAFLRFAARLRRLSPAVVHTYLSTANVFGSAAARAALIEGLITTRRDTGFADGWLMRRALSLTNRWARRVVAVSEDTARIARQREGIAEPRLTVIPNGVDLDRFGPTGRRDEARAALGIPLSARLLATVSHLTPIKGIDVLVEAAPAIRAAVPGAHFLVAGRGIEQERVQRRIHALGLGKEFRLLGSYDDVPGLLEAADLFVLPSRSEGQPNAVIEAMAMGLPVVASRVGGVPEVARHDREALLVEPDEPERLAGACREVLTTPDLAERLGRAGRERARAEFSLPTMLRRYADLYADVARGAE
jgi:glycosyltransferase involved in cell wall biosynthesis